MSLDFFKKLKRMVFKFVSTPRDHHAIFSINDNYVDLGHTNKLLVDCFVRLLLPRCFLCSGNGESLHELT